MSTLREARFAGLLLILSIAHFFSFALLGSVIYILYAGFDRTPAAIALELLPGIVIAAGAYISGNMLSRSDWATIRPGLLLCAIASCCLFLWDSGTSFFITVAVFCGGFGLAAITLGGERERAGAAPSDKPSAGKAGMQRSKLLGSALGLVFSALLLLSQESGTLHIRSVRITFMILFAIWILLLSLTIAAGRSSSIRQNLG